ncbi:RDD family protein [Streptomyces triticirhizae]|uniref:RDD family protein n=1 Tax=Streptomyces triticirhizae TaxID=2483353 RepID=A0A3M2LJA1_9ACTN|nr:RDD family protein [Streptomyces triticirhizae]RMI37562.1 RDD family protein [Streptomyces triticirhizae]
MSSEQPQPGPGGEPERNRPFDPAQSSESGLPPAPPPPATGDTTGVPGGGGDRYPNSPYGGPQGAADPLAGMPPLPSRWRRLVARIIDTLIVGIPVTLILWPFAGAYDFDDGGGNGGSYGRQAVVLLVYFVYEALMLSARGQTLGKMAMKIRVAMLADGSVPRGSAGWLRAGVYSLPQLLPCVGFVFWLVNVLFCTWDQPYRQCLHDKAARTVVVSTA